MRIWVVGGGSLGLLYAARINDAVHDAEASLCSATLITRTEQQAQYVTDRGIELVKADAKSVVRCQAISMDAVREAEPSCPDSPNSPNSPDFPGCPDWIFLAVKQYGLTDEVGEVLRSCTKAGIKTKVLAMQNGIGHIERLAQYVPLDRLYAAVVSEGALRTSPASVEHTGSGLTKIGAAISVERSDESHINILKELQNVLHNAGFQTVLSNNLNIDIWQKLIINSVINPLTALLHIRNGELIQHDSLLQVMECLFDEAFTAADESGIQLDRVRIWEQLIAVCRNTADNRSSMLQDMESGRPTELAWINGAIVRIAENLGIRVPTHETMVRLLQARVEIR